MPRRVLSKGRVLANYAAAVLLAVLLGVLLAVLLPRDSDPAVPSDPYAAMIAATVILETSDGHGSGVVVGPGLILTARHVAEEGQKQEMRARWANGEIEPVDVVWLSADHDIALMRFPARAKSYATAPIACAAPVAGEPVTAVGNPLVLEFAVSSGHVASSSPFHLPDEASEMAKKQAAGLWGLDVPIVPGNSGGPVFNRGGGGHRDCGGPAPRARYARTDALAAGRHGAELDLLRDAVLR